VDGGCCEFAGIAFQLDELRHRQVARQLGLDRGSAGQPRALGE
jgi:hypothetical protein